MTDVDLKHDKTTQRMRGLALFHLTLVVNLIYHLLKSSIHYTIDNTNIVYVTVSWSFNYYNIGFGFVEFETEEEVDKLVKSRTHVQINQKTVC